jgi:hypothetical protein
MQKTTNKPVSDSTDIKDQHQAEHRDKSEAELGKRFTIAGIGYS